MKSEHPLMSFLMILGAFATGILLAAPLWAESRPPITRENSTEALEMIAGRMQALSSTLDKIPELPQLDSVIQLPLKEGSRDQEGPADQ